MGKIRYKIINGKRRSLCDYLGECKNMTYAEVYPSLLGGEHKDKGWSYLCKKHLKQEKKHFHNKLPYWVIK